MKLMLYLMPLLMTVLRGVESISCYTGANSTVLTAPGCTACQTVATFQANQMFLTMKSCLTALCVPTNNIISGSGVKVLCCTTDNCNNQVVNVNTAVDLTGSTNIVNNLLPGTQGGFQCYNKNNTISTGCGYCVKKTTSLIVSSTVVKDCLPICVPINAVVYKIECCQTDFCNHATSLLSPTSLTYFAAFLLAGWMSMGGF